MEHICTINHNKKTV